MSVDRSTTATEGSGTRSAFQIIEGWPALSPADSLAVSEFWISENAIQNTADADKRLSQVVLYARAASGEVVGVATAVPVVPPRFGQPMYYFRAFIGQAWRGTPLVRQMMVRACAVLETYARERNFPCIGVLLELENARFNTSLRSPFWRSTRFHYIGKSERGLEMRAFYFEGARLKTPAEIEALRFPIH